MRKPGRKSATRAIAAPATPFGAGSMTAPSHAAKVKSGPGTANAGLTKLRWTAPATAACGNRPRAAARSIPRSEEHTSELQSLMRISYAVFCLKKKKKKHKKMKERHT